MPARSKRVKEPLAAEYGERLIKARKRTGLTQKQAGAAAGISESTYRSYEKGRSMLPVYLVPVFAQAFRTTVEAIHGLPEPANLSQDARLLVEWFEHTQSPILRRMDMEVVEGNYKIDLRSREPGAAPPAPGDAG